MKDPFPGVRQYLETEESKRGDWNRSQYNRRAREVAAWAIEFLILLCERQTEREVAKVLTEEKIDKLVSALLTQSRKKSRKTDPQRQGMIEREYQIAAMLMEKSLAKSFEQLEIANQNNMALSDLVLQQVRQLTLILRYPGRHWSGVSMNYDYDPARYRRT
jgi:hypothetical protein